MVTENKRDKITREQNRRQIISCSRLALCVVSLGLASFYYYVFRVQRLIVRCGKVDTNPSEKSNLLLWLLFFSIFITVTTVGSADCGCSVCEQK